MASYEDFIGALTPEQVAQLEERVKESAPRDRRLRELATLLRQHSGALVLGAGVSCAAKVPAWNELIASLMVAKLAADVGANASSGTLSEVYGAALPGSAIVRARYVRRSLGPAPFKDAVRSALYARATAAKDTALMMSLARMCHMRESVPGGIREVVTYNFDALFEDALTEVGRAHTVTKRGRFPKSTNLPLHHVHGFLPKVSSNEEWVVFSEDEYHEQYADPFAWSNIIQLNAFSQRCCVFVGLSLDDPNIRRLLDSVSQRRAEAGEPDREHYAFLRATKPSMVMADVEFEWRDRGRGKGRPSGDELDKVAKLSLWMCRLADIARENVLKELGVRVIWYDEHADLPGLIDTLTKEMG